MEKYTSDLLILELINMNRRLTQIKYKLATSIEPSFRLKLQFQYCAITTSKINLKRMLNEKIDNNLLF